MEKRIFKNDNSLKNKKKRENENSDCMFQKCCRTDTGADDQTSSNIGSQGADSGPNSPNTGTADQSCSHNYRVSGC